MENILIIFTLQMIYVPLLTLRTTFIVKGQKGQAALFAFLEAMIYLVSLGLVFRDLSNFYNMGAYVLGYSLGVYLGGIVEQKLAIGYRSIHVNLTKENKQLIHALRELKFGVTTYVGEGINHEKRYRLDIVAHRNREAEVIKIVKSMEENAFIVSYEPTQFKGGYIMKQMSRFKK
jgi:uncharacterized protein YebE (UPF0316 family)